jgi:hypothetical protein
LAGPCHSYSRLQYSILSEIACLDMVFCPLTYPFLVCAQVPAVAAAPPALRLALLQSDRSPRPSCTVSPLSLTQSYPVSIVSPSLPYLQCCRPYSQLPGL